MKTIAALFVILSVLLAPFVSAQAAPEVGQCRVLSWDSNGVWIVWYSANMSGGPYYATFRLDSYNGHPVLITGTDPGWIIEGTTVKTHLSWPFLRGETWKLSGLICFDGMGNYQDATQDWWYAWINLPFLRR